jgi:NAD-dependent dihydropyrimidine dehydrogenase PreA subunit
MLQRRPAIDTTRCAGCGRCLPACPQGLLSLDVVGYRKLAALRNLDRCTACQRCASACLVEALRPQSL